VLSIERRRKVVGVMLCTVYLTANISRLLAFVVLWFNPSACSEGVFSCVKVGGFTVRLPFSCWGLFAETADVKFSYGVRVFFFPILVRPQCLRRLHVYTLLSEFAGRDLTWYFRYPIYAL